MKILFLNQAFYPDQAATAQVLLDLALYLKNEGHEISVISGRRGYDDRAREYSAYECYQGIHIHRARSTGLGKSSVIYRVIDSLTFDLFLVIKLIRFSKQDMVISFTSPPLIGFLGALFCFFRRCQNVQWLMDINPDAAMAVGYVGQKSIVGYLLKQALRFSLKSSHRVVVLDRWMKDRITKKGVRADKIAVVPPWTVQADLGRPASKRENFFRMKYGFDDQFLVMYSGNHSVVHPLDTLLGAAVELKNASNIVFLFVGTGNRVADVLSAKKRYGLSNVIHLPRQPREELVSSLAAADLHVVIMGNSVSGLVHTSKIYGVLAAGKPYLFIGPKDSHVADLIVDYPFGYHVEHGNVEGVIKTIETVRNLSPESLGVIASENQALVKTYFTPQRVLESFHAQVLGPLPDKETIQFVA